MGIRIDEPSEVGECRLPDGRLLGWSAWGPLDGRPVLLSPGAATSRWLGVDATVLDDLGVRLHSVDRPGLGASTPAPGRTLEDFADDLTALLAARGLGPVPIVGFSQGAPFALACVARAAGPVASAVAIVSGADEVADARVRAALPEQVASAVHAVARDPDRAERELADFGPEAMWRLVLDQSPEVDRAVYSEPGFRTAYVRAMNEAFAAGGAGYARDTVLAMRQWSLPFGEVAVPVDLWYGEQDTSHSPDHGVLLAARIPGSALHLVPGGGGSIWWTHTTAILRRLLRRADGASGDRP